MELLLDGFVRDSGAGIVTERNSTGETDGRFESELERHNKPLKQLLERGRPACNAPQARSLSALYTIHFSRCALIAGGTPAFPVNS